MASEAGRVFSALTAPAVSSDSSILTAQAFLPVTLSLTFCNHEILMTDIEFKVQFMSESSGRKGSCKGAAFQVMEGFQSGAARLDQPQRCEHRALGGWEPLRRCGHVQRSGHRHAAVVTGTQVTQDGGSWRGPAVFAAGRRAAAGSDVWPGRTSRTPVEASGEIFFLFPW